jgi:hypothetical protein
MTHPAAALGRQRACGLALGYEDLNDHDQLRHVPLVALLAEAADLTARLAGKSTLNRLELSAATVDEAERYKKIAVDHAAVDRLLVDVFLQAHAATPPAEIVLDLDATDDPVHGAQEGRFFHGLTRVPARARKSSALWPSSAIRRGTAGAGRGAWWRKPSSSPGARTARAIRGLW